MYYQIMEELELSYICVNSWLNYPQPTIPNVLVLQKSRVNCFGIKIEFNVAMAPILVIVSYDLNAV